MRITHWLATAVVLSALHFPAVAQDGPQLAPSTPWNLDYDDDSCALRRGFGEGDRQAYIELRRFHLGERLQATVSTNWMKPRNPSSFRYRFGEEGEWREVPSGITVVCRGLQWRALLVHAHRDAQL